MSTRNILLKQSRLNPCMLIWNIAKWNLSEGKITENVFGLIRINLEKSGIKIFDND